MSNRPLNGVSCAGCHKTLVAIDDCLLDHEGRIVCDVCWALGPMPRLSMWKVMAWTTIVAGLVVLAVALLGS